jgi:hypothetical protein
MSSAWEHVVNSLGPEYRKCLDALNDGPKYKCSIFKKGRQTILQLEEYWNIDNMHHNTVDKHTGFDDHIAWISNQLINWPNVRRLSWDQWAFNNKQDAEKFQTFFNLKWAN